MNMVTFQVQKEMDLEEWKDHVLGAGAFMWDWWVSAEEIEDGVKVTWYSDIDHSDETKWAWRSYQGIANACSKLAQTNSLVAEQLINDDFDAVGMDCVLQYAFLGEVIYG